MVQVTGQFLGFIRLCIATYKALSGLHLSYMYLVMG